MASYFDASAPSSSSATSHRFAFSPAASSRAVPLSHGLLSQNPGLTVVKRSPPSHNLEFSEAFILPRRSAYEEDTHSWGDDEYSDDEDDSWSEDGDDESEAGDEWKTRDGLLVLPSRADLRPHPRPDFEDYDGDSVYEFDPADEEQVTTPGLLPSRAGPSSVFSDSDPSDSTEEETDVEETALTKTVTTQLDSKQQEDLDRLFERALALRGYKLSADGLIAVEA